MMGNPPKAVMVCLMLIIGVLTLKACTTVKATNSDCEPKYRQVYSPPTRVGGAGSVMSVPSYDHCAPQTNSQGKQSGRKEE